MYFAVHIPWRQQCSCASWVALLLEVGKKTEITETRMPSPLECINCGARLGGKETRCPICGASVRLGRKWRFCPYCGADVAQRAHTCLMCQMPLDDAPMQGVLRSISWTWVVAVALLAMLSGIGWSLWRAAPRPEAKTQTGVEHNPVRLVGATSTPYHLATPTSIPPTPTPQLVPTPVTPSPTPTPLIHVVRSGETLQLIAAYYDVTLKDLMQANGLDEEAARRLRVGQEITIPGPVDASEVMTREATKVVPTRRIIHTVQPGDTLISIAAHYGADLDAIIAANPDINPDLIYVSQQIVVPLLPPTSTPTHTLTPTPTSTPGPPLKAPTLLYPVDGQIFEGPEASIVLNWTTVETLGKRQLYLVEVELPNQPSVIQHITHSTSWRLPAELRPNGDKHTCLWRVTIVEEPPDAAGDPATWYHASPPSPVRHFEWR